ncbi:PHB depolymerase family esterase [Variovorax sp. J22R115]|uniref:extracellular catalytic domain type 1 short-chain-length polyhydroxyalkanoate depolymerase n=1 Tax=Variovorax sp. J22R115 TaxID=3053509 RepID=UPI0025753243|nr:PHB depolymerase family esterase [Variovorax sp. J22R115]
MASGRFTEGHYGKGTQRRYMLYEPARRSRRQAPLLVMLHGCSQSAEEFAAGTRMNEAAESSGVLVLYPEQSLSAHPLRCWTWYALQDPSNSEGDAAVIAAMTREVMHEHDIDPARVYVAGMSAGGAMAAVLGRDYPRLYAALGVHSGAPAGLAHDVYSGMRLMSGGPRARTDRDDAASLDEELPHTVASIVFHGDADALVHPSNAEAIHGAPRIARDQPLPVESLRATTDASEGRRAYTRSVDYGPGGVPARELWIVHGAGHAWAGGSETIRLNDASGPDASHEMLRFFLQHRLAA